MSTGNLFIISAPSGAGKTTILREVLTLPGIDFSVSHTTRAPRPGEVNGRDYFFVTVDEFDALREQNAFLEWAEVHGNRYGTSRDTVQERLDRGHDVVLDIDVQGAAQLREKKYVAASYIFIAPPSLAELRRRLSGRGTEKEETVNLRIANARREMEQMPSYDFVVINDDLQEAVESVRAIVIAKRLAGGRTLRGEPIPVRELIDAGNEG